MKKESAFTLWKLVVVWFLHLHKAKVTVHQNFLPILNPSEVVVDRGLSETIKVVAILTLPVSKLLRSKIHDNIRESSSETRFIDELSELDRMSFFPSSYAKWLKMHGVQIVPLDIYALQDDMRQIMKSVDGILLTGGAVPLYKPETHIETETDTSPMSQIKEYSYYTKRVKEIIKFAKQINKEGRVFPVWTTCLGFEGLILGESNLEVPLLNVNNTNYPSAIKLLDKNNDLAEYFDSNELNVMERDPIFYFNHEHAFHVSQFNENEILARKYKVIAEAFGRNQSEENPIVAIIESQKYPFYGVQFHPEKNQFEKKVAIDRNPNALSILGKFSKFYCDKLRGLSSKEDLEYLSKTLTQYSLYVGTDIGVFEEVYIFQKNN